MDYKDLYNSGEQNDSINISGEKYIATMILYIKKKRRETLHGSEGLSERCFSVQQVKSLKKKRVVEALLFQVKLYSYILYSLFFDGKQTSVYAL